MGKLVRKGVPGGQVVLAAEGLLGRPQIDGDGFIHANLRAGAEAVVAFERQLAVALLVVVHNRVLMVMFGQEKDQRDVRILFPVFEEMIYQHRQLQYLVQLCLSEKKQYGKKYRDAPAQGAKDSKNQFLPNADNWYRNPMKSLRPWLGAYT